MTTVLVVAPHADDETLGCAGTLLSHKQRGDTLYWLLITGMSESAGFSRSQIERRTVEVDLIKRGIGFDGLFELNFDAGRLDTVPVQELVQKIGDVINRTSCQWIYVPFVNDIHTDHRAAFNATMSCTKWFRYPSVKRVFAYETVSETDFVPSQVISPFTPNVFVNISKFLDQKIELANLYQGELQAHPFPRSNEAINALARLRGAASGFEAAEAFMLLKEIRDDN